MKKIGVITDSRGRYQQWLKYQRNKERFMMIMTPYQIRGYCLHAVIYLGKPEISHEMKELIKMATVPTIGEARNERQTRRNRSSCNRES